MGVKQLFWALSCVTNRGFFFSVTVTQPKQLGRYGRLSGGRNGAERHCIRFPSSTMIPNM